MNQKDEAEFRDALTQFSVAEIAREFELFKRLIYKSTNQHCTAHYFKKIQFTKRLFLKIIQNHSEIYRNVQQLCSNNIDTNINLYEKKLSLLLDFTKLLSKADQILKETYLALKQVASQTYFMSICMTFMGVTARLFYLMSNLYENTNLLYLNIFNSYERCVGKVDKNVDYSIFPTSIQRISEPKLLKVADQNIAGDEMSSDSALKNPTDDLSAKVQKKSTVLYDVEFLDDIKPKSKRDPFFDQLEKPFKESKNKTKSKKMKKKRDDIDDIFSNL